MTNSAHDPVICDLARKLIAAHHSYAMGITLAYAYNSHAKNIPDEKIGGFWKEMAGQIVAMDLKVKSDSFAKMRGIVADPKKDD